jgi:hypothetical protein
MRHTHIVSTANQDHSVSSANNTAHNVVGVGEKEVTMSDVLGDAPQPRSETMHDARDVWRVQLGTGEIRAMTLDALDAAFEKGIIDESTPVLAPFAPTWSTLGIVAGLEEDTQPDLTPSLSPVALSTPPPLPTTTDRPVAPDAFVSGRDLDLDLPEASEMRPRRGLVIGVVATSVVGLIALPIVITSITDSRPVDVKATSVAAQLPPPTPSPSTKGGIEEREMAKEAAATSGVSPHQLLDEDQKKQLAEADKAREEKEKARKAAEKAAAEKTGGRAEKAAAPTPAAPPKRKPEKAPPALLNGGDRFDPLNGAL